MQMKKLHVMKNREANEDERANGKWQRYTSGYIADPRLDLSGIIKK